MGYETTKSQYSHDQSTCITVKVKMLENYCSSAEIRLMCSLRFKTITRAHQNLTITSHANKSGACEGAGPPDYRANVVEVRVCCFHFMRVTLSPPQRWISDETWYGNYFSSKHSYQSMHNLCLQTQYHTI